MTSSTRVITILLGLSVVAMVVTGSVIFSRLAYLWIFLLLGNWAFSYVALHGVTVAREPLVTRSQVGHVFEERFQIDIRGRLPRLWLEIRDESNLPGSQGSRVLTMLGGNQSRSYRAVTRLTRRGSFVLGPTVMASGDPFGLFPVERTVTSEARVLVYPQLFEISAFPGPSGVLSGGEALRRRTHQVTPNAAGVREYEPGDALNRIHWASTARRGRLMAKEFELDPLAPVWIFVDAAAASQSSLPFAQATEIPVNYLQSIHERYEMPPDTEEYAVSIAASVAQYYIRRKRAVGLACRGDNHYTLPAEQGNRQLGKILEALAMLRAEGDLSLLGLTMAQARHLPRGSTAVVVTSSTSAEVAAAMDHLVRRSLRPIAVLLDAGTFGGPGGTEALAASIQYMGIPVKRISNGDDLGLALSSGRASS